MKQGLRRMAIVAAGILLGVVVPIVIHTVASRASLSPQEKAFAGRYRLTPIGNKAPAYFITFLPDRSCVYEYKGYTTAGADSQWEIHNGHLHVSHRYNVILCKGGPVLPLAHVTETDSWLLGDVNNAGALTLKSSKASLSDATLTRIEGL